MIEYSIKSLEKFLFCPYFYYFTENNTGLPIPVEKLVSTKLPEIILKKGLHMISTGQFKETPYKELIRNLWRSWLENCGAGEQALAGVFSYEVGRNQILKAFFDGSILRENGQRYIEPRMTRRYKQEMVHAGLMDSREIFSRNLAHMLNIEAGYFLKNESYSVLDAIADSILMAEKLAADPIPGMLKVNQKRFFPVQDNQIAYMVDLVDKNARIWILDFSPEFYFPQENIRDSFRVQLITAGVKAGEKVRYLHCLSGRKLTLSKGRSATISLMLLQILRSIEGGHYLPAFLLEKKGKCQLCSLKSLCIEDRAVIHSIVPGVKEWATRIAGLNKKYEKRRFSLTEAATILREEGISWLDVSAQTNNQKGQR